MADTTVTTRPAVGLWIVGGVALFWNLIGLYMFYTSVTATPEQLAGLYSPEQVAVIESTPAWAELLTAVAVIAGIIGSILLLVRHKLAVPLFVVSLGALVLQDIYIFGMTDSLAVFGPQPLIIQGTVLLIAAFLAWYARAQRAAGVLS